MYVHCMCTNWSSKTISYNKDYGNKSSIKTIILEIGTASIVSGKQYSNILWQFSGILYLGIIGKQGLFCNNLIYSFLSWSGQKWRRPVFYPNCKSFGTLNMWMVKLYLCIIITGLGHYFLISTQAVIKTQDHIFPSK